MKFNTWWIKNWKGNSPTGVLRRWHNEFSTTRGRIDIGQSRVSVVTPPQLEARFPGGGEGGGAGVRLARMAHGEALAASGVTHQSSVVHRASRSSTNANRSPPAKCARAWFLCFFLSFWTIELTSGLFLLWTRLSTYGFCGLTKKEEEERAGKTRLIVYTRVFMCVNVWLENGLCWVFEGGGQLLFITL